MRRVVLVHSGMIVEGKLDRVGGKHVLLTTGRYGFRTYDVSEPANPDRGIQVLKLDSSTAAKSVSRVQAVRAPAAQADPYAPEPVSSLSSGALICPAFRAG